MFKSGNTTVAYAVELGQLVLVKQQINEIKNYNFDSYM